MLVVVEVAGAESPDDAQEVFDAFRECAARMDYAVVGHLLMYRATPGAIRESGAVEQLDGGGRWIAPWPYEEGD